jgi:hypothetical protein
MSQKTTRIKTNKIFVSFSQRGNCQVCGKDEDLRFGACFDCCDFVQGEQISSTLRAIIHRLWDGRNPENEWFVEELNGSVKDYDS